MARNAPRAKLFGGYEWVEASGRTLETLGCVLEGLGRILEALERVLRRLGGSGGPLGAAREGLGSLLGRSWTYFGGVWELSGHYFGVWEASLKLFVEIMKIGEKPWKVLQTSRFGGSQIR